MADLTNELDDLETLITSPGWVRVMERFEQEWGRTGTRYLDILEKMLNTVDRVQAADELQRVVWVRKELEAFMHAIPARLQQLKHAREPVGDGQSRRGLL